MCGGARRTSVNQRSRVQWRRTEAWQRNVILQCEEQGCINVYTCTHTHTHTHACILPHTPWRAKHPGEHGSDTMLRQTTRTTGMMKYCSKHTHTNDQTQHKVHIHIHSYVAKSLCIADYALLTPVAATGTSGTVVHPSHPRRPQTVPQAKNSKLYTSPGNAPGNSMSPRDAGGVACPPSAASTATRTPRCSRED